MDLLNNAQSNNTNKEIISLKKKLHDKEEEWRSKVKEYEWKLEIVEKALGAKMKQLIEQLR